VKLDGGTVSGLAPALLHYHDETDDDGFLFRPGSAVADAAADRVNRSRAEFLGLSYRGLRARPRHSRARRAVVRSTRSWFAQLGICRRLSSAVGAGNRPTDC
jgi:hypothetical protein